nr:MAG TPA: hypothetical protein [Caudoviricetes sp.]
MDKTKLNLERLRAYDAEWEEDKHPRAENGQFTSGSGSAGGGTESGSKYGYSRSEQHVASKMEEWGNEQGNIAALEAADAFRDAREDENDMREVLKSVRQHLVENEDDIRGYDENPKNFDKVMEQLDDMESMLNDQDDYEFKHGEIKSPFRQAAETIQGGEGESQWEHEQNIKLMKGLEQAEKDEKHQIVISWIVHDLRNGMSAKEAFAKADKDVQNGRFGGGPFAQESLRKWWETWSYKWGPQEEEG